MECVDWWCWLAWPGWGGIGGVIAVIALLVGIGFGLQAFVASRPHSPAVHLDIDRGVPEGGFRWIKVEVGAMGALELHELDVTLLHPDGHEEPLWETIPVLSVRDADITVRAARVESDRLAEYRLVLDWLAPGPAPVPGGMRVGLQHDALAEWWVPYVWKGWPRKRGGRWMKSRRIGPRDGAVDRWAPAAKR